MTKFWLFLIKFSLSRLGKMPVYVITQGAGRRLSLTHYANADEQQAKATANSMQSATGVKTDVVPVWLEG